MTDVTGLTRLWLSVEREGGRGVTVVVGMTREIRKATRGSSGDRDDERRTKGEEGDGKVRRDIARTM